MRRPEPGSPSPAELTALTERELEVLTHVARGRSNAEIAASLYVTAATVKTHLSRLLTELDARERAQLIVIAYESGLVVARPPDRPG